MLLSSPVSALAKQKTAVRKQEGYPARRGSAHHCEESGLALVRGTSLVLPTCSRLAFSFCFMHEVSVGSASQTLVLFAAQRTPQPLRSPLPSVKVKEPEGSRMSASSSMRTRYVGTPRTMDARVGNHL